MVYGQFCLQNSHLVTMSRLLSAFDIQLQSTVITLQTVMPLHCGDGSNVRWKGGESSRESAAEHFGQLAIIYTKLD